MATNKISKSCICVKCIKSITQRSRSIQCDQCKNLLHIRCTNITNKMLKKKIGTKPFVCEFCIVCRCGNCNIPVFNNQNHITCDNSECSLKYHLKCTNISIKAYNLLKNTGEL